ncbi:MAG: hypothetical protein AAGG56_10355 [Pseudomonadota bacterium]
MRSEPISVVPSETVDIDTSRILILRQSVGDQRCREILEEVIYHLSDKLTQIEFALESADFAKVITVCSRLANLSEPVGLEDFARVARDLRSCVEAEDATARAAVAARLMRLGDNAICSMMNYADQTAL